LVTNKASDTDQPPQTLRFSLLAGPTNATISTNSGILTWRPTMAQANSTNSFSVVVTDNGVPNLSATQSFAVIVNKLSLPTLAPMMDNSQFGFLANGDFGPDYTIQASTNLTAWTNLFTTNSPALPFSWVDTNSPLFPQRFYRLLLGP